MRRLTAFALLAACGVLVATAGAAVQAGFDCSPACGVSPGTTVTFGSTSTSSSPIRIYEWDLDGDGLHGVADDPDEPYGGDAQSAQRTFREAGSFRVGLRVTNRDGERSTTARTVTVGPATPPGVEPLVPSLPTADEDGDGVSNAGDLCPRTAARLRTLSRGCSLVDAVVSPAALLDWAADSVARTRSELRVVKGVRRATRRQLKRLSLGLGLLSRAGARLADDPCLGSRTAGKGLRSARKGLTGISAAVRKKQKSTVALIGRLHVKNPKAGGDTDGLAERFSTLAIKRAQAKETLRDLARVRRLFASACRARVGTGKRTLRARVVEIDPTYSLARLSNGTSLALGSARGVSGLRPGVMVEAKGTLLKGRMAIADSIAVQGLHFSPKSLGCHFKPKIAPVQDFAKSYSDLLYYDHRGYLDGSKYVLEGGMGIGAELAGNCDGYDDYRLQVFLDYRNVAGQKVVRKPIGAVRGFPGSEPPARIPEDIEASDANKKAKLTFELWGYHCTDPSIGLCSSAQLLSKRESPASLRPKGGWGTAIYDRVKFSVEDGSKTDFDTATLVGVGTGTGEVPNPTVFGVGYGVKGGQSTFPNAEYIVVDEPFAVHDDVPTPDPAAYNDGQAGIPGGLLWAYVFGSRNGQPYHYWATQPNIVTDVVDFCPSNAKDSFYRLPWRGGETENVTQGNNTQSTHKDDPDTPGTDQRFAFDFRMPRFTQGWAPRGGLVEFVEEKLTANSNPKDVEYFKKLSNGLINLFEPANELVVRHQDETVAQYFHMIPGGVLPNKGDLVERGDPVIIVGNTGNSSGPHLHYHVMDRLRKGTIQIRFQVRLALGEVSVPDVPCVIPDKNVWRSTNSKPGS